MFALTTFPDHLMRGIVLSIIALILLIALIRMVGLRSLSKMTPFDFVVTVASGSLLAGAGQASNWASFLQCLAALAALFAGQYILGQLRRRSATVRSLLSNEPILLMRNGEFIDAALRQTRVTRSDIIAKLRESNALRLEKVRAVVLETTGDISVLHGDTLDDALIDDIRTPG